MNDLREKVAVFLSLLALAACDDAKTPKYLYHCVAKEHPDTQFNVWMRDDWWQFATYWTDTNGVQRTMIERDYKCRVIAQPPQAHGE